MKKDVLIIHYNTPDLTEAAIRSLNKTTGGCHVIVFDNSDKHPFVNRFDNVEVLDNTRGQFVDFGRWLEGFPNREPSTDNDYASAKHCYSVHLIVEKRRNPFVLMDSDVLVKRDITPLWDEAQAFVGHIGCNTRRYGFEVLRVEPWLCYVNVRMMKAHGVTYFSPDRMTKLVDKSPYDRYDTGAWLFEQCKGLGLPYREIDTKDYCLHLHHGSWRKKNTSEWLDRNRRLWE